MSDDESLPPGTLASDGALAPSDSPSPATPPPQYEPLPPPPPVPPEALKPWYYQSWFIVPTFVWWPCSAILFIRSPWHNGVVSGALSWAWLIIGGGFIFLRLKDNLDNRGNILLGLVNGQPQTDLTLLALATPGILLTILTQSLWLLRDRPRIRRLRAAGKFADYDDGNDAGTAASGNASRRRETAAPTGRRRRVNRGGVRSRRRRH